MVLNFVHYQSYLSLSVYPEVTYNSKARILQLPLVAIRLGTSSSGTSEIKVMEHMRGVDYVKLRTVNPKVTSAKPAMSKEEVRQILLFAQNRRERETLTYAVCKAAGLSASDAP